MSGEACCFDNFEAGEKVLHQGTSMVLMIKVTECIRNAGIRYKYEVPGSKIKNKNMCTWVYKNSWEQC